MIIVCLSLYLSLATLLPFLAAGCADQERQEEKGFTRPEEIDHKAGFLAPSRIATYEVTLEPSIWQELRAFEPHGGFCNWGYLGDRWDWFPVQSIRIDEQLFVSDPGSAPGVLGDIQIRKKAWCGSFSNIKPGLRIKLTGAHKQRAYELFGMNGFTLNNAVQDRAIVRQCLAYALARKAGVAAPRCNLAQVIVNGENLGVYANLERMDEAFVQEHFGTCHGNLYELEGEDLAQWAYERIEYVGFADDTSKADLLAAITAIEQEGLAGVERWIDVPRFLEHWAMQILVSQRDGFPGGNNNTYIYNDRSGRGFQFVMWGADDSFKRPPQLYRAASVARLLEQHPESADRLGLVVARFLAEGWDEGEILGLIDQLADLMQGRLPAEDQAAVTAEIGLLKERILAQRALLVELFTIEYSPDGRPYCKLERPADNVPANGLWESFEKDGPIKWAAASSYSSAIEVARTGDWAADGKHSLALTFKTPADGQADLSAIFEGVLPTQQGFGPALGSKSALSIDVFVPDRPMSLGFILSTGPSWKWQEPLPPVPLAVGWNQGVTVPLKTPPWEGLDDVKRFTLKLTGLSPSASGQGRVFIDKLVLLGDPSYQPPERTSVERGRECVYPDP